MSNLELIVWVVSINWGIPIVLSLLYILPAWLLLHEFKFAGFEGPFMRFTLVGKYPHDWYDGMWVYWRSKDTAERDWYQLHDVGKGRAELVRYPEPRKGDFKTFWVDNEEIDPMEPWHAKLWGDWWGVAMHVAIIHREHVMMSNTSKLQRLIKHEKTHAYQQLLGLIFWVIYMGHMLWILTSQKGGYIARALKYRVIFGTKMKVQYKYDKHPYLDCVWERQARRVAGQEVNIPPRHWPQGPEDLWAWF